MKFYNDMTLEQYKKRIDICLVCAACFARGPIVPHNWKELPPPEWQSPNHKCPSYEYFNFRSHTGMGRLMLATSAFREDFPVDQDLVDVLYPCTNCGICNEICPSYKPLDAIAALREEAVNRGQQPKSLAKMDANAAACGNVFGRKANTRCKALDELPTTGDYIYFAGCDAGYREPELAEITLAILRAAGLRIAGLGLQEVCCGYMARWGGNVALFQQLAKRNIESLKETGVKRMIVSCAHCYQAWSSDYPKIVGELPFEVVHIAQLLAELVRAGKISFKQEIRKKITYHDPCFLGRHGGVYNEPREVLQSIPGVEFSEMERNRRWSYCCGSGGKMMQIAYPDFARGTGKERLKEAGQVAETVVTACSSCLQQLKSISKNDGWGLEVCDITALVAAAMGIQTVSLRSFEP